MRPGFLVFLLVLTACKNSPTEPEAVFGTVNGTITYAESGAPVVNARVTAHMAGSNSFGESYTGADGHYSITVIGGTYTIQVFAPGSPNIAFQELVVIAPGTQVFDFPISVNRCATMSGRVIDQVTRAPIAGATLSFFGLTTVSNADGGYRFDLGCPPQPTRVSETIIIEHPSYQRREFLIGVPTYSTILDMFLQPK